MALNTLVKQVEINLGGGIRISVYKQIFNPDGGLASEEPHRIAIGPFDDFDAIIAANNAHLERMGYPAINADELTFVTAQRTASHTHPITREIMQIEAQKIEARRVAAEAEAKIAEEDRNRAIVDAAAAEAARQKDFEDAVAAAVEKKLAKA